MKLKSIHIKNYRSIEAVDFDITSLEDESFTYGLIGVNEVGKSSILKSLSLKGGVVKPTQKDFIDKSSIEIAYIYIPDDNEVEEYKNHLRNQIPDFVPDDLAFNELILKISFDHASPDSQNIILEIPSLGDIDENGNILEQLKQFIYDKSHKPIFWTAEDRYLISQPINLTEFANSPDTVSIPLKNCFTMAGITDIQGKVNELTDSTIQEQLQVDMGKKVTEHIKDVWPNHPIEITFLINNGLINFHVKDLDKDGKSKGKAKTADQRSDGFKQFISFLLTISAQDKNSELSNSILLLDEPETHLHPQAQEYLLKDLVKITKNKRNNIVFFATHSNYMIDKEDLSRNYKITKTDDKTEKTSFDKKISTYASVTYEVFDIPSTDYHNELYSKLHQSYIEADLSDKEREYILNFDKNFLSNEKKLKKDYIYKKALKSATLPTYIRNCIDHPDNGNKYDLANLRESIELLRSYL